MPRGCIGHDANRLVALSTGNAYTYDGLNRLVRYAIPSSSVSLDYYYSDRWQLLEAWQSGPPPLINQRFVWGLRYVDDLVLRDRSTAGDGTLDERIYSMHDAHWNVVALYDSGIVERHAYDAYGNIFCFNPDYTSGSTATYNWSILYSGYLWDASTYLYYVRNRVLHAPLGRWLQRDRLDYGAGDMNLYAYVADGPTNGIDPSGLWRFVPGLGTLSGSLGPGDEQVWTSVFGLPSAVRPQ